MSKGGDVLAELTPPEMHYAQSGELGIFYQVFGQGSRDFVYVPGIFSHIELAWESV
jgi:hypothetical protein